MVKFALLIVLFSVTSFLQGEEKSSFPVRIMGTYAINSVEKLAPKYFRIEFKSLHKTGQFDTLKLDADHVHLSLSEGSIMELRGEIIGLSDGVAELSQALVSIRLADRAVPVWLLSRHYLGRELRSARFLEMHAPTSDYLVL